MHAVFGVKTRKVDFVGEVDNADTFEVGGDILSGGNVIIAGVGPDLRVEEFTGDASEVGYETHKISLDGLLYRRDPKEYTKEALEGKTKDVILELARVYRFTNVRISDTKGDMIDMFLQEAEGYHE